MKNSIVLRFAHLLISGLIETGYHTAFFQLYFLCYTAQKLWKTILCTCEIISVQKAYNIYIL